MRKFFRRLHWREGREIFFDKSPETTPVPSPEEDANKEQPEMDVIQVNMNKHTELYPNAEEAEEQNVQSFSVKDIVLQLRGWLEDAYQRTTNEMIRRMSHVHQRAIEYGRKYIPDAPNQEGVGKTLDEQMGNRLEEILTNLVHRVFSLDQLQKGSVHMTELYGKKLWPAFWDEFAASSLVPNHHPLFKSERWKNDMKTPGAYINGELASMSMKGMERYERNRAGVLDELKRPVKEHERFDKIDLKYRTGAARVATYELGIKNQEEFERIKWTEVREGVEEYGFAKFIQIEKAPEFLRGEPVPETGGRGLIMIEGNVDEPENAPMMYLDYDYVDSILALANDNPFISPLFTREGIFSEEQLEKLTPLLKEARETVPRDRNWQFYANDAAAMAIEYFPDMESITKQLRDAKIVPDDMHTLDNNPADDSVKERVEALIRATKDEAKLKKAMLAYCQGYAVEQAMRGKDWWEQLKADVGL